MNRSNGILRAFIFLTSILMLTNAWAGADDVMLARVKTTTSTVTDGGTARDPNAEEPTWAQRNAAVGIQRVGTTAGKWINQLHFMYQMGRGKFLGGGVGYAGDFVDLLADVDFRWNLKPNEQHFPYLIFNFGYAKFTNVGAVLFGSALGIDHSLTDYLHANFNFGLQMSYGLGSGGNANTTTSLVTNFGIHWYF